MWARSSANNRRAIGPGWPEPTGRSFTPAESSVPLFLIGMGILAIWAGTALAPLTGTTLVVAAITLSGVAAVGLSVFANRLVDPLTWSAPAILVFGAASVTSFAQTRRREAQVRRFRELAALTSR